MRIARLKVDGFGPLRGEYRFHPGRVVLVVDRNETGKSSLLAAIVAALYGLEADRRSHKVLTPVERWRPWDGGSYRVELDLESDGETYTVKRDFERGTVEVWNERGLEVTASFREGKDEFPVGKKLLGLDAVEFEKCALVRQGELDLVVPGDERARRASTLQARLESAADTRGGDTSSAEAVQVLQAALRRYTSDELDFTGTVETAISRLELKRETLATERASLEHDRGQVAGPLAQLAEFGAEEQAAREAIAALEAERRAVNAGELRRRLGECRGAREALAGLEAEAAALAPHATLPAGAEAELRETLAKLEAARHSLEAREARHRDEQARRRGEIEVALAGLRAYEACGAEDADRLVALAAELRRLAGEEARARESLAGLRDALGERGFEAARVEELGRRFGALDEEQQRLLGDRRRWRWRSRRRSPSSSRRAPRTPRCCGRSTPCAPPASCPAGSWRRSAWPRPSRAAWCWACTVSYGSAPRCWAAAWCWACSASCWRRSASRRGAATATTRCGSWATRTGSSTRCARSVRAARPGSRSWPGHWATAAPSS